LASSPRGLALTSLGLILLHCDKVSSFRHIEAASLGFALLALIVSGDNGLNDYDEFDAVT
jgi:hypothetical protein